MCFGDIVVCCKNHSAQIDPTIPSQDQRFQESLKICISKELGYLISYKQTALYQNFMEFRCFMLPPIFERFTYFFCSKDSQAGTRSLLPGPAGASAQRVKEELPQAIGAYRPSVFWGLGMFVDWRLGMAVFVRRCSGKLQIQKTCYQQLLSYEAFFPGNTTAQD